MIVDVTGSKYDVGCYRGYGIEVPNLVFKLNLIVDKKRSTWPIFLLKLKDHDTLTGDDLLGYSYVWLSDMHFSFNKTEII